LRIETLIKSFLPHGTWSHAEYLEALAAADRDEAEPQPRLWHSKPPCLATDAFAIAAALLQRSGAYHHVIPENSGTRLGRSLPVSETQREDWRKAGAAWRGDGKAQIPAPPRQVTQAWAGIWRSRNEDVYSSLSVNDPPPSWWQHALALLCIADEAARDLGFEVPERTQKSAMAAFIETGLRKSIEQEYTFTFARVDPDIACVLPKSRTPRVGLTLRSLSHNLALLPPRGLARAYWIPAPELAPPPPPTVTAASSKTAKPNPLPAAKPFNVLLIPMPFSVRASAFCAIPANEDHWGWFGLEPHWCARSSDCNDLTNDGAMKDFWNFIDELLRSTRKDLGAVHAVVLPELALSYSVFEDLARRLAETTDVELLVSGVFDSNWAGDSANPRHGNFAAMAQLVVGPDGKRIPLMSVREKHHRWRLDRSQINAYALGSSLDPNRKWWEKLDIASRSVDVFVIRGVATVTALICEDLARNDPCQELVRGVGPNLVFALLMDGAQLKQRWPARYATVLAEDPGTSVLTLTSRGMLERSNATGQLPRSSKIGLWRDDTNDAVELELPSDAQALCITLQPTAYEEHSLDGRGDGLSAQSWRLAGITPVRVKDQTKCAGLLSGTWGT